MITIYPQQNSQQTINQCRLESTHECRICLEKDLDLINCCQCIGSMRFVHQKCIKQWLFRTFHKKIKELKDIKNVVCEICHSKIHLVLSQSNSLDCRKLIYNLKFSQGNEILDIMLLVFFLIVVIILSILVTPHDPKSSVNNISDRNALIAMYCMIPVCAILLIIVSINFIRNNLMITKIRIDGIRDSKECKLEEQFDNEQIFQIEYEQERIIIYPRPNLAV